MSFAPIPEILEEIKAGRPIVLVDDPDRENEGDVVIAAEKITPEWINFMLSHARGWICLTFTQEKADELELPLQSPNNTSRRGTAFTVSIDANAGTTTGVSAQDRATTILTAIREGCKPDELGRPGHIAPLRARDGGVLVRTGHTEASVDLCRLAGLLPTAVICEILNEDGTMARLPHLEEYCAKHNFKLCSIADVVRYRHVKERLVKRAVQVKIPTRFGEFDLALYNSQVDNLNHVVMSCGLDFDAVADSTDPLPVLDDPILVRVHSECLTSDIFGSIRCDCGAQKDKALEAIAREGRGVFVYMRQEGRGIGLENKLKAYLLQDRHGMDTVEANQELGFRPDEREYGIGAQILHDLGVRKLRFLTNNPKKYTALRGYGLEIVERVPIETDPTEANRGYLRAKKEKMGHILSGV